TAASPSTPSKFRPCQVAASSPRIAQVVGSDSAMSRSQPGRRNAGSQRPPSIETPRITRMLTARARASASPRAATSSPAARGERQQREPQMRAVDADAERQVAETERREHHEQGDGRGGERLAEKD